MAEAFAGMTDVLLGYDTDFHFENGDLMLTSGVDYIEREIYKLLITIQGDWKADPTIGATPEKFIGEQNSRETGLEMKDYLQKNLQATVLPAQLDVRIIPTDYNAVSVFIDIFVQNAEITSIPFTFDFVTGFRKLDRRDARTTPIKSSQTLQVNDISNMKTPNKYWKSMSESYITQ